MQGVAWWLKIQTTFNSQNSVSQNTKLQWKLLPGAPGKSTYWLQEVAPETNQSVSGTQTKGPLWTQSVRTRRYAHCSGTHMRKRSSRHMASLIINCASGNIRKIKKSLILGVTQVGFCIWPWALMAPLWLVLQLMKPSDSGKYFRMEGPLQDCKILMTTPNLWYRIQVGSVKNSRWTCH